MIIRPFASTEAAQWVAMRCDLFRDGSAAEHTDEVAAYFSEGRFIQAALGAFDEIGRAVGFVEMSIRSHAESCHSGHVGYLEGWYVLPEARRQGVGRALVQAAEDWARSQGCSEFASDTHLANDLGAAAHLALGFAETDRLITFRKDLQPMLP